MAERADPLGYFKKWAEVKPGTIEHGTEDFKFFLSDMHPELFEELFGDLPAGGQFIARLNRMIADHLNLDDLDVAMAGRDHGQLGMQPLEKNRVEPDELIAHSQARCCSAWRVPPIRG